MKRNPAAALARRPPQTRKEDFWERRLYLAGHTPHCALAFSNLKRICETQVSTSVRGIRNAT
jgi:hypothetical protein